MRRISVIILALFVCSALCAGCGRKPTADDKTLAKVSNKFITLGQFKNRVEKLPPYYKNIVEKNRKRYLDEMIVEMLFYEEAIRRGINNDREVKEVIEEAKKKILIAKLIKTEVEDKIKIEDAEARQYYETHKEEFKSPELWRASHILVTTEKEAQALLDEISRGAAFEDLARARSQDATSSRGGDVGFFRQGQLVPEVENECMKMQIGQVSGIVHTQFGYHVIKLTDKKEPGIEPYEKVKSKVEDELKKTRRSELFDKLVLNMKNKYNVEIEDDVFKSLEDMDKEKR